MNTEKDYYEVGRKISENNKRAAKASWNKSPLINKRRMAKPHYFRQLKFYGEMWAKEWLEEAYGKEEADYLLKTWGIL